MSGTPKRVGQVIWIKGMLDALLGLVHIAGAFTRSLTMAIAFHSPL